eukprot:gene54334-13528_t
MTFMGALPSAHGVIAVDILLPGLASVSAGAASAGAGCKRRWCLFTACPAAGGPMPHDAVADALLAAATSVDRHGAVVLLRVLADVGALAAAKLGCGPWFELSPRRCLTHGPHSCSAAVGAAALRAALQRLWGLEQWALALDEEEFADLFAAADAAGTGALSLQQFAAAEYLFGGRRGGQVGQRHDDADAEPAGFAEHAARWLCSDEHNPWLDPQRAGRVYHDMTRPLHQYSK